MKFSTLTTSFRSLELLLSKTAQPCEKSRHRSRFGNLWWKPIAHIWRPFFFAESAANPLKRASWRKRSRQRGRPRLKKLLKQPPKPRISFQGLIANENRER